MNSSNPRKNPDGVYPLTASERGMYLEQKLDENSISYNLNVALFIIGAGLEKVKTELKEIFAAHEAFRSYYKEENGVPVRIVSDDIPEISEKTADSIDEVKAQIDVNNKPFDLCSGIPVRAAIYSVADGSVAVHFCVHHISFDGISAKLVFEEMTDRLTGKANSAQNADLSDFDDYFSDGSRQKGMAFYKEMFADGVPQNEMPTKKANAPKSTRFVTRKPALAWLRKRQEN